ncbi:MAG: hypothetical protein C5B50_25150 [Verrucomicrobia bacterium]|nr:MAG: hypothetical protein C5B50_25150 [Verrucomicrobiota bacterium]
MNAVGKNLDLHLGRRASRSVWSAAYSAALALGKLRVVPAENESAGMPRTPNASRQSTRCFVSTAASSILALVLLAPSVLRADDPPPQPATAKTDDTAAQQALRSYLQLQEQLNAAKLALERNQKEAELSATKDAEALSAKLQAIEQSLSSEQSRELKAMQSSNRVMLVVAGSFAAIGFLAMVLMAWFQWRTVNRLAAISTGLPAMHGLGPGAVLPALGMGEPGSVEAVSARAMLGPGGSTPVTVAPAEQSSQRFLGALEQLEKRINELEHRGPSDSHQSNGGDNGSREASEPSAAASDPDAGRIKLLMGKGESLLNLDNAEGALECFEEILSIKPDQADALLKKGSALERLGKPDEAIDCYDKAIAADSTIAYLYKGGLFNRMERFDEALECYEQALRKQQS